MNAFAIVTLVVATIFAGLAIFCVLAGCGWVGATFSLAAGAFAWMADQEIEEQDDEAELGGEE